MNKYPLERFKKVVKDTDKVYSMVRLNEMIAVSADIDKETLISALDTLENNCFFYANFQKDVDGIKHLEIIRQG